MNILDCTLRDGNHAIDSGFSPTAAASVIGALLDCGVSTIEFGLASGMGSKRQAASDEDYLRAAAEYRGRGELGMFCRPEFFGDRQLELATQYGLAFLRIGTHCASVDKAADTVRSVRDAGLTARYSLIQAHMQEPAALADSARKAVDLGAQAVTIMDSTGTMLPDDVRARIDALVSRVDVPVGFHGHNNLGLSIANALAAMEAGARELDGALMGLARSAGNAPTEMLAAVLSKLGRDSGVDILRLLDFIDGPFREIVGPVPGVPPIDLMFGLAGFHSKNLPVVRSVAKDTGVSLFRLISESEKLEMATLDEQTVRGLAAELTRITGTVENTSMTREMTS